MTFYAVECSDYLCQVDNNFISFQQLMLCPQYHLVLCTHGHCTAQHTFIMNYVHLTLIKILSCLAISLNRLTN